jgi:Ca2+-binding RTX toxin-like protein
MASQEELNSALSGFYTYLNNRYPAYSDLQDEFTDQITALSLTSSQETALLDGFDSRQPMLALFGPTEITAINQAMADATLGGGAAYLRQLSYSYPALGTSVITNVAPNKSLFDALDTTILELAPASNQNFPEVATLGRALTIFAMSLGLGFGVHEIYNATDPEAEGVKQGVLLGTGMIAGEVIAGLLAGPLAISAGVAAALGALGAAAVGYVLNQHWNDIVADVTTAKGLSTSEEDTIDLIHSSYGSTLQSDLDQQGATAVGGMLNYGQGMLGDLMGAVPQYPIQLPAPISSEIQPAFSSAISAASPLVIDLSSAHTGVTLTAWNASTTDTFFDLNASGFAVQTAWVGGDTGLLARDLNSNGAIDSAAELFGSPTVDGFAKLAALDSNHDLRIDINDADWSTLVVWTDDNGDAVTQSGELHSLASLGIANIDLAGVASSTSTISGNPISHTSKVTFTGGATATIADAWFVHDNTNSYYAGDYTLDVETLFLPTLRGYGTLPDLTIAMSQDSDLKDMVAEFASTFTIADIADTKFVITDILYKWAGVEGINPNTRGPNIDAQHLEFVERLVGTEFVQKAYASPNPQSQAAALLEEAYQAAYDMLANNLLIQVGLGHLFASPLAYNVATGMPSGGLALSQTAIEDLAILAPAIGPDNVAFWIAIADFLDHLKGIASLTGSEAGWLNTAVTTSNAALDWSSVVSAYESSNGTNSISGTNSAETLYGGTADDTIHGYNGADIIYGSFGNDTIYGDDGDDTLFGDAGNDTIRGGAGNDLIYGGIGNDTLYGDYGNDTYYTGSGGNIVYSQNGTDIFYYGGGDDLYSDTGGSDQIVLPTGITLADLSFARVSTQSSTSNFNDLLISIAGGGTIQIQNEFTSSGLGSGSIESILFSDLSTLDLTTLANPTVYLTSANDSFSSSATGNWTVYGGDGDDYIYNYQSGSHTFDGGNGNDTLRGGSGSDTYIASAGFDIIQENGGSDTIVVPIGFTIDDVTFYRVRNSAGSLTTDLGISINGLGEIDVQGHFGWTPVESMYFLEDSSTISLTTLSITTVGTADNDNLYAPSANAGANDVMDGREGNDYLAGGAGDDKYIFSAGADRIYDSAGDDTILIRDSYSPEDITIAWNYAPANYSDNRGMILTDSDGNTLIVQEQSYFATYGVEHIKFADGTTWNLNAMELELYGTSGNDGLEGRNIGDASSADTIYGLGGNDTINGRDGNDLIYGGDGDDYLLGNAGDDVLYGGDGADIFYAASNDGNDVMHGDAGGDTLKGADHCVLYGDDGDDQLWNIATSPYAANTLVTMYGGNGSDTLYAGYGQNIMNGGAGADTLNGSGSGVDTFQFDAATAFDAVDTLNGFQKTGTNHDVIDISDVLDGHYEPLTDVITNFVQITTNGSNSELYVDVTGTATFGTAQHIATIQSVTGLTDEDALVTAGVLLAA